METLALVAHNEKKDDFLEWVKENKKLLRFCLIGTEGTAELLNKDFELGVEPFGYGPHGDDILLTARILEDQVDRIIFL